jgi:hypothetical protein
MLFIWEQIYLFSLLSIGAHRERKKKEQGNKKNAELAAINFFH